MNPPKAAGPQTVEAKANAIALGKATRKARSTMGKKQKLAIEGVLPTAAEAQTLQASSQEASATSPVQVAAPAASSARSN